MTLSPLIWIALLDLCLLWILVQYFVVRRRLLQGAPAGIETSSDAQPNPRKPWAMVTTALCAAVFSVAGVYSSRTVEAQAGTARTYAKEAIDLSRFVRLFPFSNAATDSVILSMGEFQFSNALYLGNDQVLVIDDSGKPPTLVMFPSDWLRSPDIPDRADRLVFQIIYTSKPPRKRRIEAILSSSISQSPLSFRRPAPALADSLHTSTTLDSARVEPTAPKEPPAKIPE